MGKPHDQIEELRQLQREVNGLLKDLRRERREIEKLVSGVREQIRAEIVARVDEAMKGLAVELKETQERATAHIYRRYDKIGSALMGQEDGSNPDRPPMEDLVRAWLLMKPVKERARIAAVVGTELKMLDQLLGKGIPDAENEYIGADGMAAFPKLDRPS